MVVQRYSSSPSERRRHRKDQRVTGSSFSASITIGVSDPAQPVGELEDAMLLVNSPQTLRRLGILILSAAMVPFLTLTLTAQTPAQKTRGERILSFDVPGAGTESGQGTVPRSINANGEITGEYYDQHSAVHGFLRTAGGAITTFDVPRASKANGQGTFSESVNSRGEITGFYYDASSPVVHTRGFTRDVSGSIMTFDGGPQFGTIPTCIDAKGETTGAYSSEGFMRASDGAVKVFAVNKFVTVPKSINARGEITGWYDDERHEVHGFIRSATGAIKTFDAGAHVSTTAVSINLAGEITGYYASAAAGIHGFRRSAEGSIDTFDVEPDSSTIPYEINEKGEITGAWYHANSLVHGFVIAPDGTITKFDAPGAAKRFAGYGTTPQSINARGEITGWYSDARGIYHGFVRIPASERSPR